LEKKYQEAHSMKKLSIINCVVMVIFLLVASAFSQDQDQAVMSKSGKGACKADIETFCKGIKPGGGRLWACIKSNEDRISQGCRDHIAMAQEKRKEFVQACKGDSEKFCEGIPRGKGRIVSCLKSHEEELSNTCKALFQK
jgi:hypothetical protein